MKKSLMLVFGLFAASIAVAQPAGAPSGPHFGGAMNKLFGDNQAFSANLEMQGKDQKGNPATIPGKITVDSGKSRFELDMTQVKPSPISPDQAAQIKQFGLDKVVMVDRPDKKTSYMIYAGLQSYVENPMTDPQSVAPSDDFKITITELGKETVDGHPCVKNKAVVTDKQSNTNSFIVWNATDLKNFPVKLQTDDDETMSFKNISFSKPDASVFDPPSGYTKYDSMMAMMRDQMMKQMRGTFGR